jgi:hypothetical protein
MSDCPHKNLVKVHDAYVCHFCRAVFDVALKVVPDTKAKAASATCAG